MSSRVDQLLGIFAALTPVASGGCADREKTEDPNPYAFIEEAGICDGELENLLQRVALREPVDYLELRDAVSDRGVLSGAVTILDSVGEPCSAATDPEECLSEFAQLPLMSELEGKLPGEADGDVQRSLAYTRSGVVGSAVSLQQWHELLGLIDTPEEAALMALGHFYDPVCVTEVEDGYMLRGRIAGGVCGEGIEEHVVAVSLAGALEVRDSDILEEDISCVGRVPSGLCRGAARGRGAPTSVGRFLATAAMLERASVDAFEQLAVELAVHAAPASLVSWALRSRDDERRHARATARLAGRYGATPDPVVVRPFAPRRLIDVVADNAVEGCIRETYGALVGTVQGQAARDPVIRRVMRRIAADETRHAALSWEIARWADTKLGRSARRQVATHQRIGYERLEHSLTQPYASAVHRITGLPEPTEARRLYRSLRPQMLG